MSDVRSSLTSPFIFDIVNVQYESNFMNREKTSQVTKQTLISDSTFKKKIVFLRARLLTHSVY